MRIGVLEECVKSFELESKSSREMALRLTAELDRERRKVASSAAALDSIKLVMANQHIRITYFIQMLHCRHIQVLVVTF